MAQRFAGSLAITAAWMGLTVATLAQETGFDHAMNLFRERHWAEAATAFAQVEAIRPGETDALLYRGKSLVNQEQYVEAAIALDAYRASHPKSEDAIYLLAYVRFRENKPEASLQLFTVGARLKAPAADDLKIVALDYVLLGDYFDASRYLEEAAVLAPHNMDIVYHLGRVSYQQNRFDQALSSFRLVLKHDPTNVRAQNNLGLTLEATNEIDSALAAYRKAIEFDRTSATHSEQPYLNLGILLSRVDKPQDAIPLLLEAAKLRPHSAKTHYELGKVYFSMERIEDARREVEEAILLTPEDAPAHYLLGRIYHRLGNSDLASRQFSLTEDLMRPNRAKASGMGRTMEEGAR